jgi:hypothetical protein
MGKKSEKVVAVVEKEDEEDDKEEHDAEDNYMEGDGEGSEDEESGGGEDMSGDDAESEVDEDELEMEKAALLSKAQAKTPKINKEADLMEKLGDIVLGGGKKVPWAELFYVSSRIPAESIVEDVDDDLKREVRQSLHADVLEIT